MKSEGERNFEVPFAVMRQIGTSMEDQLVSGFTRVIREGTYADGTPLPGIRKLAVMFGVSEITIRNAVKRLCRDGLLAARPRVGLTVCVPGGRSWRGTVLGIKAGPPGMYYANVFESAMSTVLRQNGWLYSSISVSSEKNETDFAILDMMLQASVSLAVMFNATSAVSRHIEKSGVRFVEFGPSQPSSKVQFPLDQDETPALESLAEALKSSGVKSVLSVYQHPSMANAYSSVLEDFGLCVRRLWIRPIGGHNTQECVQRAGLTAFDRILSEGGIAEDAVVCNDDYLAAGVLSAFDRHGVRMPDDVRFATMSNRGLGPVHLKDLTRIEYDPARMGAETGRRIVGFLEGRGIVPPGRVPYAEFRRGETV